VITLHTETEETLQMLRLYYESKLSALAKETQATAEAHAHKISLLRGQSDKQQAEYKQLLKDTNAAKENEMVCASNSGVSVKRLKYNLSRARGFLVFCVLD
jgi:hypothetical protein